MAMTDFLPRLG